MRRPDATRFRRHTATRAADTSGAASACPPHRAVHRLRLETDTHPRRAPRHLRAVPPPQDPRPTHRRGRIVTPDERATICRVAAVLDWLAVEARLHGRYRPGALQALARRLRYGPEVGCTVCGDPLPPPARTGRPRKRCTRHGHRKL